MVARSVNALSSEVSPPAKGATLELAAKLVAAYVSNNPVPATDLAGLIKSIHGVLAGLPGSSVPETVTDRKPAVAVHKSITPEFIICLEDGKKLKMLKRYLRSRYHLSPEAYRTKWGLPLDYPMVAPNYAARRSEFAKKIGLGRSSQSTRQKKRT